MEEKSSRKSALSVSKGVSQPPAVNPKMKKIRRRTFSVDECMKGILNGDRTMLSRAITMVESNHKDHELQAAGIIKACLPYTGKSIRVGITGVPGVGKSSFIDSMGIHIADKGHKLAVLAIDPSSERSGGSILGDKTRMEELSVHPNAFIRPSASAGSLGGVARKTRETVLLCEAAGFDVIFVETVGVGQSETAVHSMVDFFLLLMLAGAGDELQGIKRGIMEMADLIAITKSDGSNCDNANRAAAEFRSALHLFPSPESGRAPKVFTCSAHKNNGMDAIWDEVNGYKMYTLQNEFFALKRRRQARYWMYESINDQLKARFYQNKKIRKKLADMEKNVLEDKVSSFAAAREILNDYFGPD